MKSPWLWVFVCGALGACAAPVDPVERQFQCMEDPECRVRLEHRHVPGDLH